MIRLSQIRTFAVEQKGEKMDDLISRQAAIDVIESHIRTAEEPYQLTQTDKVLNYAFEVSASCVYNLPSVQPERKVGQTIT